jgi:hypothetical protein
MPFWIFGLTNPLSLLVYFSILEIAIKVVLATQHASWSQGLKSRLLIYIILLSV